MLLFSVTNNGSVSEWLKEADCKSVALCYVGSNPTRPTKIKNNFQNPLIPLRIRYKTKIKRQKPLITIIRNFEVLNKFLNGVNITKINPAKLLIKNRGYRAIFIQKSFIKYNL